MAVKKVYLTSEGARVSAYCQNNDIKVNFLCIGLGSGENYNPSEVTKMTDEKITVPIQSIKRVESNHYKIRAEFSNDILTQDLVYRELCLYCADPENTESTVMYCYGNAKGNDYDYTETIPAFTTSGNASSRIVEIDTYVQGDNATFFVDQTAKADSATVQELREDLEQEIADREQGDKDAKNLENATGVLSVGHGGTGANTDRGAQNNLLSNLDTVTSTISDETTILGAYQKPGATSGAVYKRPFSSVWTWIQSKISSVLGLTATSYNKMVNMTMVDLGFTKDSDVSLLDFWKKIITKNYRPAMTICVGWQDAKKANLVSGDTRINVNGGVMHIGACGSPNVAWQTLQILYENSEGHTYNITAKVSDTVGELFHESIKEVITSATIGNQTVKTITDTLPISKGGTGKTTAVDACNELINALSTETTTPQDADYYVSQFAGGGTTTTTYHRRPLSALWEYIKGKISSVLGLTKDTYNGKAKGLQSTLIPTGANLNDYTTVGRYHAIENAEYTNAPCKNFTMEVIQMLTSYKCQIVYMYQSGRMFIRTTYYNGSDISWGSWKEITQKTELNSYIKDLSISGKTITYTKGDNTTGTLTTQDTNTTYSVATTSANGLMSSSDKSKLDGIETGANKYTHPTTSGNKHIPSGGSSGQILRWSASGTAVWGAENNTTYSEATSTTLGLVKKRTITTYDSTTNGSIEDFNFTSENIGKYLKGTVSSSGSVSFTNTLSYPIKAYLTIINSDGMITNGTTTLLLSSGKKKGISMFSGYEYVEIYSEKLTIIS